MALFHIKTGLKEKRFPTQGQCSGSFSPQSIGSVSSRKHSCHLRLAPLIVTKWLLLLQWSHQNTTASAQKGAVFLLWMKNVACHISKQRILQPSSHYSHPGWWALRKLRMETNGLPTAKPSAPAATPSGAPWGDSGWERNRILALDS